MVQMRNWPDACEGFPGDTWRRHRLHLLRRLTTRLVVSEGAEVDGTHVTCEKTEGHASCVET